MTYSAGFTYRFNRLRKGGRLITPTVITPTVISPTLITPTVITPTLITGADPGFQVRGAHLKKIAPSGRRCENCWGISCEKSRFYDKKIIFFPIAEGSAKIFGVFRVKNHDLTPKNHIFSNFRRGHTPYKQNLQSMRLYRSQTFENNSRMNFSHK